jgi:linoleoyl-CoA desaturase
MAKAEQFNPVKFIPTIKDEFSAVLRKRVNTYFKENNIAKTGNWKMYVKTIGIFMVYFGSYGLFISGISDSWWFYLAIALVLGVATAGIGMAIMHDANHGSYSKKQWINKLLGYSINMCAGASATNWKIQHNVLHHTYTNIEGLDEDIDLGDMMKFTPSEEDKPSKVHRFQWIYASFLYGLLTLNWTFIKDFSQAARYSKWGLMKTQQTTLKNEVITLIITKVLYFGYMLVLPLILLDIAVWEMMLFFFITHFVCGSILSWVFQLAHVVEEADFPEVSADKIVHDGFYAHQLKTTANFHVNRLFSWYMGGLNHQVEHHLFPNISHVHYRNIMPIVKKTAEEFGLPYNNISSFGKGMISHLRWLKKVGNPQLA